jgi:uncharacterized protein YerC
MQETIIPTVAATTVTTQPEENLTEELAKVIADMKNPKDIQSFLTLFLSENELSMLAKRLAIFKRLSQNVSYETIQHELSVSSATVSSIAQIKNQDFAKHVANVINAQDWAEQTASKLRNFFTKSQHPTA